MNIYAYARLESEQERRNFRAGIKIQYDPDDLRVLNPIHFRFDGLAGQRQLIKTINEAGPDTVIAFNRLSDAGRDLQGAIKTLAAILTLGAKVYLAECAIEMHNSAKCDSRLMLRALEDAIALYTKRARKIGMETARAAGAQIGRPAGKTLVDVQKTITTLMDASKTPDKPPSCRKLAAEEKISTGKAAQLLKEWREGRRKMLTTTDDIEHETIGS